VHKLETEAGLKVNADPPAYLTALQKMMEAGINVERRDQLRLGARLSEQFTKSIISAHQKRYFQLKSVHDKNPDMHFVEQLTVCKAWNEYLKTLPKEFLTKVDCKLFEVAEMSNVLLLTDGVGKQRKSDAPSQSSTQTTTPRPRDRSGGAAATKTKSKTDRQVATWIETAWKTVTSTVSQVMTWITTLPLASQLMIY
jgi:hypothetical protein